MFYIYLKRVKNSFNNWLNIFVSGEPAVPTNLTVKNRSHSNLTLEWRIPFDGGINQTNYTIQIYDEENLCREIESHQNKSFSIQGIIEIK